MQKNIAQAIRSIAKMLALRLLWFSLSEQSTYPKKVAARIPWASYVGQVTQMLIAVGTLGALVVTTMALTNERDRDARAHGRALLLTCKPSMTSFGDLPAANSYELWPNADTGDFADEPLFRSSSPTLVNGVTPPAAFPTCAVTNTGSVELEVIFMTINYEIIGSNYLPVAKRKKIIEIPRLSPNETYQFSLISFLKLPVKYRFPNVACAIAPYDSTRSWVQIVSDTGANGIELNSFTGLTVAQGEAQARQLRSERLKRKH